MIVAVKRSYFLMEVLIALAFVALCALPLMYPHFYMLKEERKFVQQVELDRRANLFIAQMVEALHNSEVDWDSLEEGFTDDMPQEVFGKLPYNGTYTMDFVKETDRHNGDQLRIAQLKLNITETGSKANDKHEYVFHLYLLRPSAHPSDDKQKKEEDSKPPSDQGALPDAS